MNKAESTHPRVFTPPPSRSSSSAELIEAFFEYKRVSEGRSIRTVERYALALQRLCLFMGDRHILSASADELIAFCGKWLFDQGVKDPVSRKPAVAAVREFFKWAESRNLIQADPGKQVPHPKFGRRLPRLMTLAHAEALMFSPDYSTFEGLRDATMLGILIGCGLRVSGLVNLNQGDVTETVIDGQVRLVLHVREKGEKERQLPVPIQAGLLLRLYMDHPTLISIDRSLPNGDQVLFIATRNSHCPAHEWHGEKRRYSRHAVYRMVSRYGKRAGLPAEVCHPHAARHLFGTELAEDDVPTNTAATMMGHKDSNTTKIYEHTAVRKLARTLDKSNPLSKITTPVSSLLAQLAPTKR